MKWLIAMLKESRGSRGRLLFFTACIAIGVAAVVGVAAMAGTLEDGLRAQSRDLLGADLKVESRRPLDPRIEEMVREGGAVETTFIREFPTTAVPMPKDGEAGSAVRVSLKAVRGVYPYYGEVVLDPPGALQDALEKGAVVAPTLGLKPGDEVRVGALVLPVAALVTQEPQQFGFMAMFAGPRVFVADKALEGSNLLGFGSRLRYQLLARMPGPGAGALVKELRADAPGAEYLRIESWRAGQPRLRRAIVRVERYLGLVALLSLVLGGVGVAQIVRAWIVSRTPSIAVLRCIGMRPKEVLSLFAGQVMLLAFIGSAIGATLGSLLPLTFLDLAGDLIRPEVITGSLFQPGAIVRGLVLGLAIALLFSLPPLTAVWRVSPARVLRNEAEPLPVPRSVGVIAWTALLGGILATATFQASDFELGLAFTLGFGALIGVLMLGARLVMRAAARMPRERLHPYLVQGVAGLARPGAGTTAGIVALGLGVTVIVSMALVERDLSTGLRDAVPDTAPTMFLVDVQPDQKDGVDSVLADGGATAVQSAPIVMARMRAINGVSIADIVEQRGGRARWTLTREQRMSPMAELPESNEIVAGELWNDPDMLELSLEERYARDMGVNLNDTLRLDVQGVPMEFKVTSLRRVEWRSFSLNFFVGVEPGALEGAPNFRIAAARLPAETEQQVQDRLAAEFPNVTMIRIRPILEQVVSLLDKIADGVRVLGAFTVFAGLAILAGAISAATLRRRRETALLKTLGATRRGVGALFIAEYGLLGAVAGLLGSIGALVLAWGFLEGVAELDFGWPLWTVPAAALGAAALTATCGVLASLGALQAPPREALRG